MIIKCPTEFKKDPEKWEIFLAGPIQDAEEWQNTLPEIPEITWISPRRESYDSFDYVPQVDWETRMLRRSNIVIFYIPPEKGHTPGHEYAQTTRTEFGEILARGKKVFLGVHNDFPGRKYLEEKLKQYDPEEKVYDNLNDLISAVLKYIDKKSKTVYFTSDTHFSSHRALELSRRPFKNINQMDWYMIEKWNDTVVPGSKVFHLGDFGNEWALEYLSGKIIRLEGNYERKEGGTDLLKDYILGDYYMCHEPLTAQKKWPEYFGLFGHIHGRQRIKKFGIDVGVDANNFKPMSLKDVEFYRTAITRGYYDAEVWC